MKPKFQKNGANGAALIICLSLIVLLTALVFAFFSRTQLNRSIEASGAARARAEILARTGLEYVRAMLTEEITDPANSDEIQVASNPDIYIYRPKSPQNMLVEEKLQPSIDNNIAMRQHLLGLVKQSIPSLDANASDIQTHTPDKRGKYVRVHRWNNPNFAYSGGFAQDSHSPNWIYFSTNGASKNPPFLGRIAFNLYQLDGMLDASVAGYPQVLDGNMGAINKLKGSVAGANLAQAKYYAAEPGLNSLFVQDRNPASASDYVRHILENTNGFLEPLTGDTHFVSRLDLLRYGLTPGRPFGGTGAAVPAMAKLTPWSRAVNAPSWSPPVPNDTNVFAPAIVRSSDASITTYRDDATHFSYDAKKGDALVARRFPLARLKWFDQSHFSSPPDNAIEACFGLQHLGGRSWRYIHTGIKTLSEVAAESPAREANFFEILKTAIETGSLGRSFAGETSARDADRDLQILQIGASIIDVADSSNSPLSISLHKSAIQLDHVYGIKDLPYLYSVRFRQIIKTDENDYPQQIDQFALPILVNPHKTIIGNSRPPVRIRMIGNVSDAVANIAPNDIPLESRYYSAEEGDPQEPGERAMSVDRNAYKTPAAAFSWTLEPDDPAQPSPPMPDYFTGNYQAFWLASGTLSGTAAFSSGATGKIKLEEFNLVLEYWNGSIWVAYDALIGDGLGNPAYGIGETVEIDFTTNEAGATHGNDAFTGESTTYFLKPDPRSTRWGIATGKTSGSPSDIPNQPVEDYVQDFTPDQNMFEVADPDLKNRPNDLTIGTVNTMKDVLSSSVFNARPVILHRPYETVGELGVAFRGQPWKTLDFATDESADGALLDYFCITDGEPDGIVSGRFGMNATISGTLIAMLSEARLRYDSSKHIRIRRSGESSNGDFLALESSGEAINMADAKAWIDALNSGASRPVFMNVADLAGESPPAGATKYESEALVRALGTAGQTRTWNFFIDLIAQTGRMQPENSNDLNDFIAQGEVRLWMQFSIDRFTGKVIASHVEAYQE